MLRKLKLKKLKKRLSRANSLASLIVGLGNPGDEYKKTRHNAGFLFVDRLALSMGWVFSYEAKFKAQVAKGVLAGEVVRLIKPQTFMNKSGYSVAACVKYLFWLFMMIWILSRVSCVLRKTVVMVAIMVCEISLVICRQKIFFA